MADGPFRAIAVIPARGGSKRLPGKALLPIRGKPMIAHTIEAAIASDCFDKIVVSSDADDILRVSSEYGAIPYRRSADLAGDSVPTAPVLLDILQAETANSVTWDILSCLYATAPLRTAEDIRAVVGMIDPGVCDFAMAVSEANRPVHQAMTEQEDGTLAPVWPDRAGLDSKDAPSYVFGNGTTYAVSVPAFLEHQSLYGPGLRGYAMPPSRSVDLNTPDDLKMLEYFAETDGKA